MMAFNNAVWGPGLWVAGRALETILQSQNSVATDGSGPGHSTPSDSLRLVTQGTACSGRVAAVHLREGCAPAAGAAAGVSVSETDSPAHHA